MSKKRTAPTSLGELTARPIASREALQRLASPHPSVRHILEVIEHLQARPYTTNVIIGGEPGTGKEGLAQTLHDLMHPEGAPLVSVSTSGFDEAALATELFGVAPRSKGDRSAEGAVAEADGGTLVLDEAVGLSPALQRRLLEVVRKGHYQRQNETRDRRTQLNLFVVTDGNLLAEVRAGRFRHDLYHRLGRLDLVLPPLRERPEDVPSAALWMANRVLADRGREPLVELEPEAGQAELEPGAIILRRAAIDALRLHRWPGNFRELEVVVERALLLYGDGTQITAANVERALADPRG